MRFFALAITLLSTLSAHAQMATPAESIDLAMAKPLEYVGMYLDPGSESGTMKTCVFHNEDVTVLYEYCRKVEAPAVSIRIYVNESGSSVNMYAEGALDASQIRRDFYFDGLWRVRAAFNTASYKPDMTLAELRAYDEETAQQLGCSVFFMEGMDLIQRCFAGSGMDEEATAVWVEKASAFWHKPSESWYAFQKLMRTKVKAVF